MANGNNLETFKLIRLMFIITFIFAMILVLFALFNQHEVLCTLMGYQVKENSLATIVSCAFAGGAIYAGILGTIYIIKLQTKVRSQKREIQTLKEQNEE